MKNLFIILFLSISSVLWSQNCSLTGMLVDESSSGVEATVCILVSVNDSTNIETALSNETGSFSFENLKNGKYILYLQHMAFVHQNRDVIITEAQADLGTIVLDASSTQLGDVVIKRERPIVKSENGRLIYDASLLSKDKAISNAFDMLRDVPGIIATGDKIELVGMSKYTILINGQITGMSFEQLMATLKSIPASRVTKVEIMYSAPPQYNIRGAAINVELKDDMTDLPSLQGQGTMEYRQAHYAGLMTNANILYTKPSFVFDMNISLDKGKSLKDDPMFARHQFQNNEYEITQQNGGYNNNSAWNARLGATFKLSNKDQLRLIYNGNFNSINAKRTTNALFLENGEFYKSIDSRSRIATDSYLHNINAEYNSHRGIIAGADYTNYEDPTTQYYEDYDIHVLENAYRTETSQKIGKATFYANQTVSAGEGWEINYGLNFSMSRSRSQYEYFKNSENAIVDSLSNTKQKESAASLFTGVTKSFGKLSTQISFSANKFKSTIDLPDESKTLWNDFQPFLNANLTYTHNPNRILQLSFSSDIEYPSYWALSPNIWQINAYSVSKGNPELKYTRTYETQAVFIINQKYVVMGYYNYKPNYSVQLPYQSDDRLETVFQVVNLDYRKMYGLVYIHPLKIENIWDSKATVNLFRLEEKDDSFHGIPYNRFINSFQVALNNTFNISSKPNLKLDVAGTYTYGAIQGVYDIGHMSDVTAGLRWLFLNDNAELIARVQDIFKGNAATVKVNYADQYSSMRTGLDSRILRLSFIYRFGNYKNKKSKEETPDTSRFNRGN
ncbi:outer membrane receptor protein involved in Fe transport [Dysgonomonas alginatilytica]|uniref:Outer membrane receptor protein involved in Fe transport n=1 Tax=Dysgonomonas alginatilytica TaxID=1605892 RepID=A0A2V3PQG9_9BACT|nr:outer membrane beta-barrel family protein [Dysgonomonas alginatilytica]PXV65922.1 outer membrane receptor protein involved in Fe transport [Dysgonomonas alginatilytica]